MPISCCVLGCFDRGKFSLPVKYPSRWKNWLKSCPYLEHYNLRQLECKRICSKHFIPEHFDNNTNLLSDKAVPILNLPKINSLETTNDNSEEVTQNEETIETIEDFMDPSLYSSSIVDETSHYDTEECILLPFQQSESIGCDPLQMTPKQSPIDYDGYEESVIAYSPPPDPIPSIQLDEPPQFIDHPQYSGSPIIKPQSIKVPRVVLHRLPPIQKHCRFFLVTPKPNATEKKQQNDNQTSKQMPLSQIVQLKNKQLFKRSKLLRNSQTSTKNITWYLKGCNLKNTFGKTLPDSQVRLTGTACDGAHYTTKEKIFTLSLIKQSSNSYNILQGQIALPSKDSINSLLNDIPLRPGINEFIFQYLAYAAKYKTEQRKECALLFGEMKINKYIKFNVRTGIIEGFQDLGSGKRANKVGDKALVFMLCGLFQLWKLPIAYYITGDVIEHNNAIFQKILIEIIMAIYETGFVVKATVSDHSPTNVEAINSFLADNCNTDDNIYYEIENKRLFHIYDVTNIMESLKSYSNNDDLQKDDNAKWNFLESLFQIDSCEKGDKTNEYNQLKFKTTSQAVNRSTELEFWDSALCKLNSMKYDLQEGQTKPLPVNLFIDNIKTTKKVWEDLQARGCAYVRRLNLKPLNFLFRKIKENNTNINSNKFIIAYRSILINNLISCKSLYANTEIYDNNKILGMLKKFTNSKKYSPYNDDVDLENIIYYTEKISSKLPIIKALCAFFVSNKPYKDCSQCRQTILLPNQYINSAVWKSISVVDELLPGMLNIHVYPLILILQQEVETSWFACAVHRVIFFRILWIFIIKLRAKKWCKSVTKNNDRKNICDYLKQV